MYISHGLSRLAKKDMLNQPNRNQKFLLKKSKKVLQLHSLII